MYYEVEGTSLRLAGTMHMFPEAHPTMPQWLWDAYDWCEYLAIESEPIGILPHLTLPDGSSLSQHLPPQVCLSVKQVWPEDHALGSFEKLTPWAVLINLPSIFVKPTAGVEMQFLERAKSTSKKISVLETATEIASLFNAAPDTEYADAISFALADPARVAKVIHDIHTAWLTGRVSSLEPIIPCTIFGRSKLLRENLLVKRNVRWMSDIKVAASSSKRSLIAVGAMHLCGQRSVLDLLSKAGHRLRCLL